MQTCKLNRYSLHFILIKFSLIKITPSYLHSYAQKTNVIKINPYLILGKD